MKGAGGGRAPAAWAVALRSGGIGLAATLLLLAACRRDPPRPPHILVILIDTLRARNLGCYGYARPTSPAIDRFAQDAMVFEQAISVGGNTTTAMAGLFTGHYAFFEYGAPWTWYGMERFRVRGKGVGLPNAMTTLAEHLASARYRTAGFITNPYLKRVFSMHQGYGHYEPLFKPRDGAPAGADQVVERALRYLRGLDWKQPTFLYMHFMDTHGPYLEPAPDLAEDALAPMGQLRHDEAWKSWEKLNGASAAAYRAELRYMMASYDTATRHVDDAVGQVLQYYRDRGLYDQTVFVITADHGEEFLEHGGTGHWGSLFEEVMHVPLVVRAPGGKRGVRVPRLVRNFDAMPTLLDYAEVPRPPAMDAISLRPLLEGRPFAGPTTAYAGFPGIRMIRTDRYKLLRRQDGSELFFDLEADPGETTSLSGSKDPRIHEAYLTLGRALDRTAEALRGQDVSKPGQPEAPTVDEPTRAQLRALGYLE